MEINYRVEKKKTKDFSTVVLLYVAKSKCLFTRYFVTISQFKHGEKKKHKPTKGL